MSGSLSIYRNIIAQERESAGSLQGQDLLKPKYLKSMRILSQLLCESDEEKLKEVHNDQVFLYRSSSRSYRCSGDCGVT